MAHKWAGQLHNPRRPGAPHRLGAGGRITGGPQVGQVATLSLPPRGSPPLLGGGGGRIKGGPQVGEVAT